MRIFLFVLLSTLLGFTCLAQDRETSEGLKKKTRRYDNARKDLNVVQSTRQVDNSVALDPRAVTHYKQEDINKMTRADKMEINFMYGNSFKVEGADAVCKSEIQQSFDIYPYLNKRKDDESFVIPVKHKGCSARIELMSWNEFQTKCNEIRNANQ